ncbi:3'-5' exoribonuclease [Patescibacteria group bacterium]|nr:3'-5' exoribonuclease [Patescibacteria group bacterium]
MIALDVETTGTDFEKHSILSIGAVSLFSPTEQFYGECRAFPGAHIEDRALEVNGFSRESVLDESRQSEAELVRAFLAWTHDQRDLTTVGQNPSFDVRFIEAACRRGHLDFPLPHRSIDIHSLAFMHMTERGIPPPFDTARRRSALNMDGALRYCGIPEEPAPHNALTGALCHAEVAHRLLYGRGLLDDFTVFPVPWTVHKIQ